MARLWEYGGRKQTLSQWARELGISRQALHQRLTRHRSFREAMQARPVGRPRKQP